MTTEEREIAELQNNLEMLRKLFGWTAEQLGNRLGVTKQTVLNLEHGKPVMTKIQYIAIRSVMETEAMSREGEEKENLLKVLSLVFNEDKTITEEQREKALDAAKVVSTATAAGAGVTAMGVLTGSLTALGIGAVAVNPAIVAVAGAVGVGGWVAGMLIRQSKLRNRIRKGQRKMINLGQIVKTAEPLLKQAGRFIKANPHLLIEGGLAGGLLVSLGYNAYAENEHEQRDKLVENQLRKDQAIIKDLSVKAQKVDKLEKCNELLMDALTKKSPSTVGA